MSGVVNSAGKFVLAHSAVPLLLSAPVVLLQAISVDSIGPQQPAVGFIVTGSLVNYTVPPALTYSINAGASLPITTVTATAFSIPVSALAAGTYSITVTDGTTLGTSNAFVVSLAPSLSLAPIATATAGNPIPLTGTTNNYGAPPGSLDISFDGGSTFPVTVINSALGNAFSVTIPAIASPLAGTYQVVVRDHVTPSIVSGAQTLTVQSASGATTPANVAGIASWWDAGVLGSMLAPSGAAVASWNSTVSTISDKAGSSPLAASAPALAYPRLAGLGGAGLIVPISTSRPPRLWPLLDATLSWSASITLGAGDAVTIYLVWSRPNSIQSNTTNGAISAFVVGTKPLITIGGTPVLSVTSDNTDAGSLILFAGGGQTVLSSAITRRHTHSTIVRITPGVGVDVWLDNVKLTNSPLSNLLPSLTTTTLTLLGSGAANGSAMCWFHEGAVWSRAISNGGEVGTLLNAAARWARGPRKGVSLIANGDSNTNKQNAATGYYIQLQQSVCYLAGLLSFTILFSNGSTGAGPAFATELGAHGVASTDGTSWLIDPGDGSNPNTWALGNMGLTTQAYINAWPAIDRADIAGPYWYWGGNDSEKPYSYKPILEPINRRWQALLFGMLGVTSANGAAFWISALPIAGDPSNHGFKQCIADQIADGTAYLMLGMSADCNSTGGSYDPTTGFFAGGDLGHKDDPDQIAFSIRSAPVIASTLLAIGRGDPGSVILSGYSVRSGPKMVGATYEGTSFAPTGTILVTVQHDAGTDLRLPLLAAQGLGFVFVDNNTDLASLSGANARIGMTSAARVSPTQIRLTMASLPAHGGGNRSTLFYIWQDGVQKYLPAGANSNGQIGRGNAVTDNASAIGHAPGQDISSDLGVSFMPDVPLQSNAYGLLVA